FLVGGQFPLNQLYPWSSQYPPRYLSVTAISITCFGFLKPSLVGMRTFIGNPYLRGRISPSNLKVIWVCGCSAVDMSIEVESPSAQRNQTYFARVSAPTRLRNSRSGVPVHLPIALQPSTQTRRVIWVSCGSA